MELHSTYLKVLNGIYFLASMQPAFISAAHLQSRTGPDGTPVPASARAASYVIKVLALSPPRLSVTASLPIDGDRLQMETSRPGEIPEILKQGWPALISNLYVTDDTGNPIQALSAGPAGWRLDRTLRGRVKVQYVVDYTLLANNRWPALREAAYQDADHVVAIGRSMFVTTPSMEVSSTRFDIPSGWRPIVPLKKGSDNVFEAHSANELTENLSVLSRSGTDDFDVSEFHLSVTSIGRWRDVQPEIRRVLGAVTRQFVRLMGSTEEMEYSVVLLPAPENGGESFRNSFAMTSEATPTRENSFLWGNTIAHEIFHLWNGWRLRGADYATSQWFQEGFTEYAANISMVHAGLVSPEQFMKRLAMHVQNYRRLKTSLTGSGTHKGPPLYSGGALTAFCWDIILRHETGGKRGFGDFMRELWRNSNFGERTYAWSDLRAALTAIAPYDWDGFYRKYIDGSERLPLSDVFSMAGLLKSEQEDGGAQVAENPAASRAAKAIWSSLVKGRNR